MLHTGDTFLLKSSPVLKVKEAGLYHVYFEIEIDGLWNISGSMGMVKMSNSSTPTLTIEEVIKQASASYVLFKGQEYDKL